MARLQRLKPITYTQLLELSGMTEAPKKEVRNTFMMTSQQHGNYAATKGYRENIPVEIILFGILDGKLDKDAVAKIMMADRWKVAFKFQDKATD